MSQGWGEGEVLASPLDEAARGARRGLLLRFALAGVVACALGSLLDAAVSPPDPAQLLRSSASPRADGYRALTALLPRLGQPVRRSQEPWSKLPPPGESVLLVLDPLPLDALRWERSPLDPSAVRALLRWVEAGGRLVLALPGRASLAFLAEGEPSPAPPPGDLVEQLLGQPPALTTGALSAPLSADPPLGTEPGWLRALGAQDQGLAGAFLAWSAAPLMHGLSPRGPPRRGEAELAVFDPRALPEGWRARVLLGTAPFVLEAERGQGRMWLVASAYPFCNLALARGGTAPLVAGLLHEASQAGARTLVVDELCHGLHRRRGLLGPLREGPFWAPVLLGLGLLGLAGWRGAVREGSPRPPRQVPRRAKEEFVLALAELLRRGRRHPAAARALLEAWRQRLPQGADPRELEALGRRLPPAGDDEGLRSLAREAQAAARRAERGET